MPGWLIALFVLLSVAGTSAIGFAAYRLKVGAWDACSCKLLFSRCLTVMHILCVFLPSSYDSCMLSSCAAAS